MQYNKDNPHPLSVQKTELVWEGKYDEQGRKRSVNITDATLPLQEIEKVDQPRSEAVATGQLNLFERQNKRNDDFRNRLLWGDNKVVMASLLPEFEGRINLIYADPPFNIDADFTMTVPIGDEKEKIKKDMSALETVAYSDMWGKGTDSYLHFMYERLTLLRDLLAEDGSIYLHCDPTMSHYLKLLMDEVFGAKNFRNEIVWCYTTPAKVTRYFPKKHDIILFYSKTEHYVFNYEHPSLRIPYKRGSKLDGKGWDTKQEYSQDEIDKGKLSPDWWDCFTPVQRLIKELQNYPTQKPEALLKRIINASSNEGDIVLDPFCGCGTTGTAAEKLERRWIMADLGRFAIHTTRKRMIDLQRELHETEKSYRSFGIFNAGRYERQWWQKEHLKGAEVEHRRVVLELFGAEVISPEHQRIPYLHGIKNGCYCFVAPIDTIFGKTEAEEIAQAVTDLDIPKKELYCLAWEFEMEIKQTLDAIKLTQGITLTHIRIPREIMEKNRKTAIFLAPAFLKVEPVYHNDGSVDILLKEFIPNLSEVPGKELDKIEKMSIKNPFDFIDFWAVDFEWTCDMPFKHHWQDYRTKKDRSLSTTSTAHHKYKKPGEYFVCVHVVDVFGCDTEIAIRVEVP